jgi:hypothetical protein
MQKHIDGAADLATLEAVEPLHEDCEEYSSEEFPAF